MVETGGWDLTTLAQAGRVIAEAASDPFELAEAAFLEIARLIPTDFFQIGLFEADQYHTLILIQDGDHKPNQHYTLDPGVENITGWIRRTGESLIVGDFLAQRDDLPAQPAYLADDPPRSALFIPLVVAKSTIGMLALQSRIADAFSMDHLQVITILSQSITTALNYLIQRKETEDLTLRLVLVQEISRMLVSLEPLGDRLHQVIRLILGVFGYQLMQVFEVIDGQIHVSASTAARDSERENEIPEMILQSIEKGELISSPSAGADEYSSYAIPLWIVDHTLGSLYIQSAHEINLEGDEGGVLKMLASQLGFAMLEARNYDERQEEAWMTTVLLEVAKHAAQPGDTLVALQAVLQLSTLLAGTEWALLLIPDEIEQNLRLAVHAGFKRQQTLPFESLRLKYQDFGITFPIHETEFPEQITLPSLLRDLLDQPHALCLKLTDGSSLLGLVLMQDNPLPGIRPSLLTGIGHQISLRLENARLIEEAAERRSLERELVMARNIQASFLPEHMPTIPGWELASAWQVAREVGGDFYDMIPLPPDQNGDRWGIVIADVADKGIPAAIYMALCRTMLRSVAQSLILPSRTLESVNRQLISDTRADLFVSVFYAVWEPSTGKLIYANAGHLPPFLFRKGERAELIREHGMVLGVMPGSQYSDQSIILSPEDLLVLYTDGVSEAQNSDDEFFGFHRIENLVLSLKDRSAEAVAGAIVERVINFSGSTDFADDLTTVTIRRIA